MFELQQEVPFHLLLLTLFSSSLPSLPSLLLFFPPLPNRPFSSLPSLPPPSSLPFPSFLPYPPFLSSPFPLFSPLVPHLVHVEDEGKVGQVVAGTLGVGLCHVVEIFCFWRESRDGSSFQRHFTFHDSLSFSF